MAFARPRAWPPGAFLAASILLGALPGDGTVRSTLTMGVVPGNLTLFNLDLSRHARPKTRQQRRRTHHPLTRGLLMRNVVSIVLLMSFGVARPGQSQDAKIWENYDFVPGSRVLFYTDFTEDRVGNFARALKYVGGPAEVVERDGVKVLRSTGRSTMTIPIGRALPARFTLEIDILSTTPLINGMLAFEGGRDLDRGDQSAEVSWSPNGSFIIGGGQDMGTSGKPISEAEQAAIVGGVTHIRVLMDESYFKMYMNDKRLYNIPELPFRRAPEIRLLVIGSEENPTFITGVRVAESDTDVLYDALSAKGRWATQGILFETGQADLKPESRPVLKEIAAALKQHADLKILIEGHTDNVGAPAANLALSDARAAAVKAALVSQHGADAARITTKGLGDTKPSVPNTTANGRAQNRRVEIVKQ